MRKSILKMGFNAFSGLHEGLVLLKDLSKPSTPNRTYMRKSILKMGFNAFSGLHEGLVLLKDLSKPSTPNRTYMRKSIFENVFAIYGSNALWVYMGFSAIERLT
jgi:hypothetical protein